MKKYLERPLDFVPIKQPGLLGIWLKNFQGFREDTYVPFAPLTLLFGPNSSGKSSVVDALTLLEAIFEDGGRDKNQSIAILALTGALDKVPVDRLLDRWANKQRHSPDQSDNPETDVVITPVFSLYPESNQQFREQHTNLSSWGRHEGWDELMGLNPPQLVPLAMEIRLTDRSTSLSGEWLIRSIEISTEEGSFFRYRCLEDQSIGFNKAHPKYHLLDKDFGMDFEFFMRQQLTGNGVKISTKNEWLNVQLSDRPGVQRAHLGKRILENHYGALGSDPCTFNTDGRFRELDYYLNQFVGSCAYSIEWACSHTNIPPIRPVPSSEEATFSEFSGNQEASVLGNSLRPWKQLIGDEALRDYVNRALSNPEFLGTEYTVESQVLSYKVPASMFEDWRLGGLDALMCEIRGQGDGEGCLAEKHVHLRDGQGNIVEIEDVGAGISQVIPILVECYDIPRPYSRVGFDLPYKTEYGPVPGSAHLHVQQPELHLHPKLQAQMADVFIERINADSSRKFLVETHSEHIMLRVLRRIRETNNGHIKSKLFGLYPHQVSVLYFDKGSTGAITVKPLRISPDGEFIDRWPNGFFTEREADLFDYDE